MQVQAAELGHGAQNLQNVHVLDLVALDVEDGDGGAAAEVLKRLDGREPGASERRERDRMRSALERRLRLRGKRRSGKVRPSHLLFAASSVSRLVRHSRLLKVVNRFEDTFKWLSSTRLST